jgi:hypothetical protein
MPIVMQDLEARAFKLEGEGRYAKQQLAEATSAFRRLTAEVASVRDEKATSDARLRAAEDKLRSI